MKNFIKAKGYDSGFEYAYKYLIRSLASFDYEAITK